MALLNNKFDVLRGWPREGAIDSSFLAKLSSGTPVSLPPGAIVEVQTDGTVDLATTPDMTSADAKAPWIVVESNQDFSGTFVKKVVCLRKNAVVRLDPSNMVAGSYTPGTKLSYNAGQFKVAATTEQIIAEVLEDDSAIDGTVVIYYDGGAIAKK